MITSGTTAQSTPENSGAGQVVYTAAGTDDGAITWSLATGGDSAAFSIDASSGAVTLTDNPDFETKSSYSFTVVATDPAGNRSQRTVSLSIVDQDETAPSVVSVALTSAVGAQNNTLNAGDVVSVTVTMSENTNVGGTPRIALNIGGSTEFATYVSGSGSASLVFQYTVQPGDTDNNGIAIRADSLQLNGGSLADASGNTAVLGHASVSNNAAFVVDTTAPSLSSSNPADNATDVSVGGDIVLSFNDEMRAGSGNVTISNGSDTRTFSATDTTQVSFSGNQVTIDPATDLNGNTTYNVQIENGALTDEAGNAYTGISNSTTLNFATEIVVDTSIVVFDLVQGSSSNHSGRTFQSGVSYDIYIRVDSNNDNLKLAQRF